MSDGEVNDGVIAGRLVADHDGDNDRTDLKYGGYPQQRFGPFQPEIRTQKTTLTAAQIKALAATQIDIFDAPGANRVAIPIAVLAQLHDDGTDYDDAASDGDLIVKYVDGSGKALSAAVDGDGFIDATTEAFAKFDVSTAVATATVAQAENVAVVLDNDGAEFTTGTRTMTVLCTCLVYNVAG